MCFVYLFVREWLVNVFVSPTVCAGVVSMFDCLVLVHLRAWLSMSW